MLTPTKQKLKPKRVARGTKNGAEDSFIGNWVSFAHELYDGSRQAKLNKSESIFLRDSWILYKIGQNNIYHSRECIHVVGEINLSFKIYVENLSNLKRRSRFIYSTLRFLAVIFVSGFIWRYETCIVRVQLQKAVLKWQV